MLKEEKINYRFQGDIEGIEEGDIRRDIIELCWRLFIIDTETGRIIPTITTGIDQIPLNEYPQAKADLEKAVVSVTAAQKDWREKQALLSQQDSSESLDAT